MNGIWNVRFPAPPEEFVPAPDPGKVDAIIDELAATPATSATADL